MQKKTYFMIITTAGVDLTYPCYTQEYEYCSKILNPDVDVSNESYFVDICEADVNDDIGNLNTWLKANPIRATYPDGIKKIQEAYDIAKSIPEKMTMFLTKVLNIWVQAQENGYMDMAKWKKCEVKKVPYKLDGQSVYVGFDMSAKIDLTSVAFVFPIQTDKVDKNGNKVIHYVCFSHSFIPNKEKLRERIIKDKVPYDAWERNGYLTVTNTEIVDQSAVMQYVKDICEKTTGK